MEHIQQYATVYEETEQKLSLKLLWLTSFLPVVVFFFLILAFPLDEATIKERNSLSTKHLSVNSDAQKNRKRPLQSLEGLSAQDKNLFFCYVLFGKSLRELSNNRERGEAKSHSHN